MKVTDKDYYMDGYLNYNLTVAKKIIGKNFDIVFMVDGTEGSGKSSLAMQMAYFCDPTFNVDKVCFNPDQFIEAVKKSKKKGAIVFDESDVGLSHRRTQTRSNWALNSMIAQVRQKNLYLFIVSPSFYFIDRRIAIFRSRALIHVYHRAFERGFFSFYDYDRKLTLYLKHKEMLNYPVPPNFRGRFTKAFPISEKDYLKKKSQLTLGEHQEDKVKVTRDSITKYLREVKKWKQKDILPAWNYNNNMNCNIDNVKNVFRKKGA